MEKVSVGKKTVKESSAWEMVGTEKALMEVAGMGKTLLEVDVRRERSTTRVEVVQELETPTEEEEEDVLEFVT